MLETESDNTSPNTTTEEKKSCPAAPIRVSYHSTLKRDHDTTKCVWKRLNVMKMLRCAEKEHQTKRTRRQED